MTSKKIANSKVVPKNDPNIDLDRHPDPQTFALVNCFLRGIIQKMVDPWPAGMGGKAEQTVNTAKPKELFKDKVNSCRRHNASVERIYSFTVCPVPETFEWNKVKSKMWLRVDRKFDRNSKQG